MAALALARLLFSRPFINRLNRCIRASKSFNWRWPDVPPLGLITFVDASKVRSTNPGCCYKAAGFVAEGQTKGGLLAFRLRPEDMPEAEAPALRQLEIGAA